MVAEGEDKTISGWLQYGAALNEGRKLFPKGDDVRFSRWVADCKLQFEVCPNDRAAAMWAAANPDPFKATLKAHPRVRTVRGLHAPSGTKPSAFFKAFVVTTSLALSPP